MDGTASGSLLGRLSDPVETAGAVAGRCAAVALADVEAATRMTLREFAERAQASEPSVLRFVRRLGFPGFVEFKLRLAEDYAVGRAYLADDVEALAGDPAGVMQRVQRNAMEAMALARENMPADRLLDAANLIRSARRVYCFGVGGSSAVMAEEAENRLFRLDLAVLACADPYKQRMLATVADPRDAILVFSITGRPRSLLDSVEIGHGNGVPIVAVTRPGSPLAQQATVLLPLDVPEDRVHYNVPDHARYGQLLLLDSLAALIAAQLGRQGARRLLDLRASLSALHGVSERQPNGD